jgi:hypothetical protein
MCASASKTPAADGTGPHVSTRRRRRLYPPSTSPPHSRTVSTKVLSLACDVPGGDSWPLSITCRSYCIPVNNPSHQPSAASLCGSAFSSRILPKEAGEHESMPVMRSCRRHPKPSKTRPWDLWGIGGASTPETNRFRKAPNSLRIIFPSIIVSVMQVMKPFHSIIHNLHSTLITLVLPD